MQLEEVQYNILQSGREDYTYLYQILWGLNIFQEIPEQERFKTAKKVLLQLFEDGFVEFYWCEEPWHDDKLRKMADTNEVRSHINDTSLWDAPSKSGNIRYGTTEKGIPLLETIIEQGFHKRFWILKE